MIIILFNLFFLTILLLNFPKVSKIEMNDFVLPLINLIPILYERYYFEY